MNTKLAENLKKIRKDHNLSQEQLAEELKVSRQAISKWESGNTYPEMDKILQICNKFNLDINDLLNNDIREIKSEQQTKNNINKYIDDFLNFISKTFNMFVGFSTKTKLKCLFEQAIIITLLLITFGIIGTVFNNLFSNIIQILPDRIYQILYSIVQSIFDIVSLIFGIIIWLHIFKTRYIDYYEIVTDNIEVGNGNESDTGAELGTENKNQNVNTKQQPNNKNQKIILRDPKHSEYKFINGLLKAIVGIIKIWALITLVSIGFILISLVVGVVLTFLITKTGVFFLGTLITLLAAIAITVIVELILLNFVFNRQNKKKIMIWTFLISLIIAGVGSGLMFVGSLDFEISDGKELMISQSMELEMYDNLVISNIIENEIEYIETNNQNIKIEYLLNKHSSSNYDIYDEAEYKKIYIYSENPEIFKLMKESINYLNDKKLLSQNSQLSDIKIYTTKENIEKLKANIEALDVKYNLVSNYETKIQNLDSKIAEQEATINELNFELESYRK
ncbi:MAG: Transcriptional regulator [Fusobacteria bacterium]|nr:MAG: Transcriptional regulator [Fusobacteriota bacterium]KAF0228629.1 MAG: Transcriptional [Fusobacteriota bacterium]